MWQLRSSFTSVRAVEFLLPHSSFLSLLPIFSHSLFLSFALFLFLFLSFFRGRRPSYKYNRIQCPFGHLLPLHSVALATRYIQILIPWPKSVSIVTQWIILCSKKHCRCCIFEYIVHFIIIS